MGCKINVLILNFQKILIIYFANSFFYLTLPPKQKRIMIIPQYKEVTYKELQKEFWSKRKRKYYIKEAV